MVESAKPALVMLQTHFGLDVAATSKCAAAAIGRGIPVQTILPTGRPHRRKKNYSNTASADWSIYI